MKSNDDYELQLEDEVQFEDEEQGMFEHFRFTVDKGQGLLRIDKYLAARMENTSRHRIQLAIDAEYVRVNEKIVKANYKVKPLDLITILLPYRRRGFEILPEKMALNIPYEDEELLIVNKPAGLVVHPGCGHYSGTLINGLAYHLGLKQGADSEDDRMGVLVHRIDKDTSGILVISKTEEAQIKLAKQFFDHSIERRYVAIAWGDIKESEGTIVGNIGRDPNDRQKFKVFEEGDAGKHAVTHYKVLERLGYVTVIECRLETGRTHQIRVHLNHIGHPLFNDDRYGGDKILKGTLYTKYRQFINNCFEILPRQALHAKSLAFIHPKTGKEIAFDSELPDDMKSVIEKFRNFLGDRLP